MDFREKIFLENFYIENSNLLIGPEDETFKPKYKESKLMNGEVLNNSPLFSFKFGFIITQLGSYVLENGRFNHIGGWLGDFKIEFLKMSFFGSKKPFLMLGDRQCLEINQSQFNDLDVFHKFIEEYKKFHEELSNKKSVVPELNRLNYDKSFITRLIDLLDINERIGGLTLFVKNQKINIKGNDWFNRRVVFDEIIYSDKVISEYLIGLLGNYLKYELKKNQFSDENLLKKYFNHDEVKSKGVDLIESFSKINDSKEKLSFMKEFVVGKTGGLLNEKKINEFEQLELLIDLIRENNYDNIKSQNSYTEEVKIVDIYSNILTSLPKSLIQKNNNITRDFIRVENKLKDREQKINQIINQFKSIEDLGILNKVKYQIEIQNSQFKHLVFISCEMIKSYEIEDSLTFFRIYETLDKLEFFNSNWETSLVSELNNMNDKLDQVIKKLNDIETSIVVSIQELNDELGSRFEELNSTISTQLKEIDSSLMLGNWINLVNTIQTYKINKNTKSLRG